MAAAADRFAVRVEDHQLDVGKALPGQLAADRHPQPLDRVAGGDLAERPAGVREAGLDAQPAVALDIGAKALDAQRLGDRARALLEADQGLEQGRDLDLVLDPEQPGEIERRQQREAGLALGDQEADRLGRVDVFQHLRDDHEHALGGRLLGSSEPKLTRTGSTPVDQRA